MTLASTNHVPHHLLREVQRSRDNLGFENLIPAVPMGRPMGTRPSAQAARLQTNADSKAYAKRSRLPETPNEGYTFLFRGGE